MAHREQKDRLRTDSKFTNMRNFRLLTILAVVAVLVTSCQQFSEGNALLKGKSRFVAYTEESSRTTMGDNYSVVWSKTDEIVMVGVTGTERSYLGTYALVEGAGTTKGVFEGEPNQGFANYCAFYPVSMYNSVQASGNIEITLPEDRVVTERNFVDGANPMVAYGTTSDGLQFRNIFGILELKIKGAGAISHIYISDISGYYSPLSGRFYVNPESGKATCDPGSYNTYVATTLDTPLELSETEARSIYVVVPQGEYRRLFIETIDTDGTYTTRAAVNPVTVERSKITPVTEFEHKEHTVPHVRVSYDADDSNFYVSKIFISANTTVTERVYIAVLTDDEYQDLLNSGNTDKDIACQFGYRYNGSNLIIHQSYTYGCMGKTMHAIAVPCDLEGNFGEVAKTSFVAKSVPIDSNYSVEISGEPTITANSIDINFATTPTDAMFHASIWTSDEYNLLEPWEPDMYTATNSARMEITAENGVVSTRFEDLLPQTEYKLVYRVMNGVSDGMYNDTYTAYSEYKVYTFKTAEYEKSDATVTLSMSEVKEWSATVNLSSSNASEYALYLTNEPIVNGGEHTTHTYGTRVSASETSYKYKDLTENTKYYLYAIAYDENGVYGVLSAIEFTTPEITPEQNDEYAKFLGQYKFTTQQGEYDNGPRMVTISQAVEGKIFHVKGLLHPTAMSKCGVTDDTLEAKFFDNMIHVGGTPILGSNSCGTAYIYATAANAFEERFYYYSAISSAYNGGVLTFDSLLYPGYNGLIFYPTNSGSFNYDYGYMDNYSNLVLTKISDNDSQLENPDENPEIDW